VCIALTVTVAVSEADVIPNPNFGSQAIDPPVLFNRDIAPIFKVHCTSCHQPNGSAPFSLLTFADARPRAERIAQVVRRRLMPPWIAEPGYGGPFVFPQFLPPGMAWRLEPHSMGAGDVA
jgi:hypothetical protein